MADGWRAEGLNGSCGLLVLFALAAAVLAAPAAGVAAPQQQRLQQRQFYQPWLLRLGDSVAPMLANYTFSSSLDTFDICRQQSGMQEGEEVPFDDLLHAFRLPKDLAKHKFLTLQQLVELLHAVQPDFKVVFEPMLSGEVDIGRLLDPAPTDKQLPRLVHFTVKDKNKLQPHQVVSMASWAMHNPGYSLMLFDDADVRWFMTTYYPQLLPTFDALGSPVERTDMWRYLVLCRLGGVYADSDVVAARPISQWAQDAGLLVGVENVFTTPEEAKERSYARQIQMVQWAIAARPGHPVVCRMGQYVAEHVAEERHGQFLDPDRDHAILERTGPGIWSDSVHDYLQQVGKVSIERLISGGRVGDVRVLPQPVLGCPSAVYHPADPIPYVYHMFKGSWRLTQPSGLSLFIRKLTSSLHHPQQLLQEDRAASAAAAVAAVTSKNAGDAATVAVPGVLAGHEGSKHPRRPILDELISEHKHHQQQEAQQRTHQQQQHNDPPSGLPAPAGASSSSSTATRAQPQVAAIPGMAQGAAAAPAQAMPVPVARSLRSSQLLLVQGVVHTGAGVLVQPGLPSKAWSGLPALSLLVMLLVLAALCKQQQASWTSLWGMLQATSTKACRQSSSVRSGLSRPGSRMTLAGSQGGALGAASNALLPAGAAVAGDGSKGSSINWQQERQQLASQLQQDMVIAASSQPERSHRHKRSWGSFSNIQQL